MPGSLAALLRPIGAGLLCGAGVTALEASRTIWIARELGWGDRLAVGSTAAALCLPLGVFAGFLWCVFTASLGVSVDPLQWLRAGRDYIKALPFVQLLGGLVGGLIAVLLLLQCYWIVLSGPAAPARAGALLAMLTVGAALVAMALVFPLVAVLRSVLGDRPPTTANLAVLWGSLAVSAVFMAGWLWLRYGETLDAVDWRLPVGVSLALLLFFVLQSVEQRLALMTRPLLLGSLFGLSLLLCGIGAGALERSTSARMAVLDAGGVLEWSIGVAQGAFDRDGDGHAARFGGGDCNDSAPGVFPGADEVAGNGVDEDCSGSDLPLLREPLRPTEPVALPSPKPAKMPFSPGKGPIIMLSVDTLRWQNMGSYGYHRNTTPHLDRLAEESLRFLRAYAPSNKTPTSIPSILSGRYPSELARSYNHFHRYGKGNTFLAERLKEAGYRTGGVAAHWYFKPKYGLSQGFSHWSVVSEPGEKMEQIATSEEVTDRALRMLEKLEQGPDHRFLLYVHYLDPHKWYIEHPGLQSFGSRPMDLYDGEIRFTDQHLGRLLDTMRSRPWWSSATIAFFSDHGEAFGEHGERFHGWSLYEHEIQVPFFLRVHGFNPGVVGTATSLIDLAPTLLESAGVDVPGSLRGVSLLGALAVGREWPARQIYSEMPPGPYNSVFRTLIDQEGRYKLIHRRHGNVYQLFDLIQDPGESKDLRSRDAAMLSRMQDRMQRFRTSQVESRRAQRADL